jgi:hypothetical protein
LDEEDKSSADPATAPFARALEQRGIVQDVVVPIAAGGAGGATAGAAEAYVSHLLNRPGEPPPPTVELPPGVDPD